MEKIKAWWYKIVAKGLVDENASLVSRVSKRNVTIAECSCELREEKNKHDLLKVDHQALRDRLKTNDPFARSLDSTRAYAARTRIEDLEAQVRHLGGEPQ